MFSSFMLFPVQYSLVFSDKVFILKALKFSCTLCQYKKERQTGGKYRKCRQVTERALFYHSERILASQIVCYMLLTVC